MGCCGQGRTALKKNTAAAPVESGARAGAPGRVSLRYLQRSPLLIYGSVTGLPYACSEANPLLSVDRRDAVTLLATPFFRQAGP